MCGIDGHVRIWSTEAIYNAADPAFANKPRQLASMSNHSGTIHAVRFSPNGRYVASGADDKIVCIYVLESNPPSHASTFGKMYSYPYRNCFDYSLYLSTVISLFSISEL